MSTTTIKTHNYTPYWDDFDETKNYHRVLYRPGYAVQARELTQMQTAMQAQIDRHGQYSFKHGSRVVGGKVTVNVEYDFIKIDSSFTHSVAGALNSDGYLSSFVGTTITGLANTGTPIKAKVLAVVPSTGAASDPNTLYIKYINKGGSARNVDTFAAGEEFSSSGSTTFYGQVQSTGTPVGLGSSVNIEEGVYFISGTFIYVPSSSLLLDKYTNTPSYTVGLNVLETITDTDTDPLLKDGATGFPNEAAPGATRYTINTALVKESLTNLNSTYINYVTLIRIENGITQTDSTDISTTQTTEMSKRLARRTFDESGNYSVEPYQLDIKEHLDDGTNNGYLTAGNGGDANKLAIGVEPGVSYVQGFRNENIATNYLVVDKPRGATEAINVDANANVGTPVGNYVRIRQANETIESVVNTGVRGVPDLSNFSTMNLYAAINQGGSVVGTARARALEKIGTELRLHLFDITMATGSFSSVKSMSQNASNGIDFLANISDSSALLSDVGNNGLVFKLPYKAVKTLFNVSVSTTEYTIKRDFAATVTSGLCDISLTAAEGHFTNLNTATMISVGTNTIIPAVFSGSPVDGATTLVFSCPGVANTTKVRIIADVEIDGSAKTQKNKIKQAAAVASNISASADGSFSLGKADCIKIHSIIDATSTDVTERFTLDGGQRDNYYDLGRLVQIPGTSPVSAPIGVVFDYYTHQDGDYFSVDSYPPADYNDIGTFNSAQGTVELRDCIDFRPRINDAGTDFTGTGASLSGSPDPAHAMSMYLKYYMPRIDKLYITKEGVIQTMTGVPSDNPKAPDAPVDSMGIYDLRLKPFVFGVQDVIPKLINNKRYTMRDIGNIDKRVQNVEYYTALSLLEQQASNAQLFDGANLSRTKNGFVVDGFRGHNVGHAGHPDYQCSIDPERGLLRPKYDGRRVNLVRKASEITAAAAQDMTAGSGHSFAVKYDSVVVLPHTSVLHTDQPYASIAVNVNPYNVFAWDGEVQLSPEGDDWKETDIRPDVIINDEGLYNQFVTMADQQGIFGTVWNEWETNWSGTDTEVSTSGGGFGNWWNGTDGEFGAAGFRGFGFQQSTTTTTATTVTDHQSRTGTTTGVSHDTVLKEMGHKVVEVNFVPFMRSRKIWFKGTRMKPDSKVYPFFNGTDVSTFCKAEAFQQFSDTTDMQTYEMATTHPDGSSVLTTNANGIVTGSFVIPRNDALKFKTGTRTFRLTDSATNGDSTTSAETQFHATGLMNVLQQDVMSTKVPKFVTSEVADNRIITDVTEETTVTWIDPVAQSILISDKGGCFIKSVKVFFKTKDPAIAVNVSLRTMENGTPTQKIVPGSSTDVYPVSVTGEQGPVQVSADASVATTVTFKHPIYLSQDQSYAIVLMAQSDLYEVWVAEMGAFDATNADNRITKQPHNGVFFTSSNSSTWTPEQSRDLKFSINRCKFNSSGATLNLVHDNVPSRRLQLNPMFTTSGSGVVKVFHRNHGMQDATNPQVVIHGLPDAGFNGISKANLNGTRTIITGTRTHDTYEFTAGGSDTASATGSGGGNAVHITENRQIDLIKAEIQNLTLDNTDIRYYMSPYTPQEVAIPEGEILSNTNIVMAQPASIASAVNSSTKTFNLRCVLTTQVDNLSPMIDIDKSELYCVQNRVIDNQTGNELSATGGNQLARYLTKKVELAEEADKVDIFVNVNRPRSANVDLYWRVVDGGSSVDINTVAWTLAPPNTPIAINDNPAVFREIQYEIDPAGSFGTMQFKIVMRSSNSSTPPLVKDFRAIAST